MRNIFFCVKEKKNLILFRQILSLSQKRLVFHVPNAVFNLSLFKDKSVQIFAIFNKVIFISSVTKEPRLYTYFFPSYDSQFEFSKYMQRFVLENFN